MKAHNNDDNCTQQFALNEAESNLRPPGSTVNLVKPRKYSNQHMKAQNNNDNCTQQFALNEAESRVLLGKGISENDLKNIEIWIGAGDCDWDAYYGSGNVGNPARKWPFASIQHFIIEMAEDLFEYTHFPMRNSSEIREWLSQQEPPVLSTEAVIEEACGKAGLGIPEVTIGGFRYFDLHCASSTIEEKAKRSADFAQFRDDILPFLLWPGLAPVERSEEVELGNPSL